MARPLFTEFVLFAAPFVAYAIFLLLTRAGVLDFKSWPPRVVLSLTAIAFVLMIGSFILLAEFSGAPPGSTYVPAHMENGKFVPARER
jgi:hypothetical protein